MPSFGQEAVIVPALPDPYVALTLAQIGPPSRPETILVLGEAHNGVTGVNVSRHFGRYPADSLDLVSEVGFDAIAGLTTNSMRAPERYDEKALILPPNLAGVHVAAGTNYVAHGEEAGIDTVFLFPKYSEPVREPVRIGWSPDVMLDYEVELCVRFQADIDSMEAFEASLKAFSLCGDFTDRAELVRKLDPDDVASGRGFTDAKSGENRMPMGAFSVVPRDWRSFVDSVRIGLSVNGEERQNARALEMIMPLEEIVAETLASATSTRWVYKGASVPLIEDGMIRKGQVVLTGTPSGVVYNAPSTMDRIFGGIHWVSTLGFLSHSASRHVLDAQIATGLKSGRYLQIGDEVRMTSNHLGSVQVLID